MTRQLKSIFFVLGALIGLVFQTGAIRAQQLELPPLFGDQMVLPREKVIQVRGKGAKPGETVVAKIHGNTFTSSRADEKGTWELPIRDLKAGGPFLLTFESSGQTREVKNVLVGDVWVCSGQSNMEWKVNQSFEPEKAKAASKNDRIRLLTIPKRTSTKPETSLNATWKECGPETVGNFSAVGYFFGRKIQAETGIPIGLIDCSWGGTYAETWTPTEALLESPTLETIVNDFKRNIPQSVNKYKKDLDNWKKASEKAKEEGKAPPRAPQNPETTPNRPSVLFQGMVTPLLGLPIKGVIWYQGEANAGNAYMYRTLFPVMIKAWRKAWNQPDLPFFFVQLAPYMAITPQPQESAWAELREAQLLTTKQVPGTGMAVITDVGEEKDIHPKKKQPVGERLAALALNQVYGKSGICSGPVFRAMTIRGSQAVLEFDQTGAGLEARNGPLTGFTMAGPDRVFVAAQAKIEGDRVVVEAPGVEKPVAVRYGWANFPVVNLWNKDGFPASPFRTDDFKGVTFPR